MYCEVKSGDFDEIKSSTYIRDTTQSRLRATHDGSQLGCEVHPDSSSSSFLQISRTFVPFSSLDSSHRLIEKYTLHITYVLTQQMLLCFLTTYKSYLAEVPRINRRSIGSEED
jgi:hypothetical protein